MMRKTKVPYIFAALLLFCFFTAEHGASRRPSSSKAFVACANRSCADSIKDCKAPRDFNSENGGCTCFDCEKGTAKQHLICTTNAVEAKILFDLIDKEKIPLPDQ
jgi:hypothetical protein